MQNGREEEKKPRVEREKSENFFYSLQCWHVHDDMVNDLGPYIKAESPLPHTFPYVVYMQTDYITIGECGVGDGNSKGVGDDGGGGGGGDSDDVNGDECDGNNIKIVLHQNE